MSYCRGKYYIYPDINGGITFVFPSSGKNIPDDYIDVFLYSLSKRKDEMKARIRNGKKLYKESNMI